MAIADFSLITDRTQLDVDRYAELKAKGWQALTIDEQLEWLLGMKGCYNYTDMNRVESAVEYVANKLTLAGYVVTPVVKKNWTITDKPTTDDIQRYFKNVADIREALEAYGNMPDAPTIEQRLTYQVANDIEQILLVVDELITRMVNAYFYSGDLYSGEV